MPFMFCLVPYLIALFTEVITLLYKRGFVALHLLGLWLVITKTGLLKYTENFITENENFQFKKNLIFFIFLLKT